MHQLPGEFCIMEDKMLSVTSSVTQHDQPCFLTLDYPEISSQSALSPFAIITRISWKLCQ